MLGSDFLHLCLQICISGNCRLANRQIPWVAEGFTGTSGIWRKTEVGRLLVRVPNCQKQVGWGTWLGGFRHPAPGAASKVRLPGEAQGPLCNSVRFSSLPFSITIFTFLPSLIPILTIFSPKFFHHLPHLRESIPDAGNRVEHRPRERDHCAHQKEARVVAAVGVKQEACKRHPNVNTNAEKLNLKSGANIADSCSPTTGGPTKVATPWVIEIYF